MKLIGDYLKYRKYLLPFVMLAAVIFVSQGISLPQFANPEEPKLSSAQQSESSPPAVVKNLLSSPQSKVTKSVQVFALFGNVRQNYAPTVLNSLSQYDSKSFLSSSILIIPARAPPA
jgi:hypothetical protein